MLHKDKKSTISFALPDYVQKVTRMLHKEGFQVHLVGGALRDVVLGIKPDDWDLATNAKPDKMLNIFPKSVSTGAKFGMISALIPDKFGEIEEVQVTTFRSEEKYVDGRWPTEVKFIEDIDRDLGRRDFTFNAMAVDLTQGSLDGSDKIQQWDLYDPFGGLRDLDHKLVRAVGTPLERFKEDGLRAYKACRMAAQLGFEIETETLQAIKKAIPVAKLVSMERIRDEFMKMLLNSSKPSVGIDLMRKTGLLEIFLPELLEGYGVEQKVYHADDVYWHSLRTVDVAPDNIKLAALLHDIAKPRCDMGDGHFYGHDKEGSKMTGEIMQRMKFSKADIKRTQLLVMNHMFYYPHAEEGMSEAEIEYIKEHEWSDAAVRRFIARVGEENIEDLFALRIADATSNPKSAFNPEEIQLLQHRISEVRQYDMALKVKDLAIDGNDLLKMGVKAGPNVGRVLDYLLERVLDDPLINTKEQLLSKARKYLESGDESKKSGDEPKNN
ncbi:HD domain-containing protein [Candidatus Nomurabacteria bacterium]|nr:HD domain-containing protein [Candidatus Nomurabacteria bacterium]